MPRRPRIHSNSGIYHIMMRGTNRQRIFHDDADYKTFLDGLRKYREVSGFALYAYCLMSNHLHLLLRVHEDGEPLDKIMRRLGAWYVYRYNRRYERSGALFDGRYKSEVVEDDRYFMAVLRYIHRNPVKSGLVTEPGQYPHSSCALYINSQPDTLVDQEPLLNLVPGNELAAWHSLEEETACLDMEERGKRPISDDAAIKVMKKVRRGQPGSLQPIERQQASGLRQENAFSRSVPKTTLPFDRHQHGAGQEDAGRC